MATVKWTMDPTHSEVQFKVRHLMISTVTGNFPKFDVQVETQDLDFMTAKAKFTAEVSSVDTKNEQRNQHLKSADFFDAAKYPTLSFVATRYEKVDNDSYELYGDLTIRNTTKNIKLDVEFGGVITDPWGNTRAGFSINGKINRKDFGLAWHAVTETGGLVAGDEVKIHVEVELIKQA
ncbi:MAG: YceI family protein [Bacteroidota bacterium]|nr:YceI family protein [Bacteroidota bacterium]MDP4211663.1 YceI family protein [Bacteroidota bacterium]MDP4250446.1 YceI family protein [Bacteroidota bacterium]